MCVSHHKFVLGNTPTMVNEKKTENLSQSSDEPIITNVSSHDVLFGRGKQSRNHRGNLEFLKYVRLRRQEYQLCNSLCNKAVIVKQVIHMVQSQMNGKFLKPVSTSLNAADEDLANTDNQTSWMLATHEEIWKKVSHCLREKQYQKSSATKKKEIAAKSSSLVNTKSMDMVGNESDEFRVSTPDTIQSFSNSNLTLSTLHVPHQVLSDSLCSKSEVCPQPYNDESRTKNGINDSDIQNLENPTVTCPISVIDSDVPNKDALSDHGIEEMERPQDTKSSSVCAINIEITKPTSIALTASMIELDLDTIQFIRQGLDDTNGPRQLDHRARDPDKQGAPFPSSASDEEFSEDDSPIEICYQEGKGDEDDGSCLESLLAWYNSTSKDTLGSNTSSSLTDLMDLEPTPLA